jgi:hypothetical protein
VMTERFPIQTWRSSGRWPRRIAHSARSSPELRVEVGPPARSPRRPSAGARPPARVHLRSGERDGDSVGRTRCDGVLADRDVGSRAHGRAALAGDAVLELGPTPGSHARCASTGHRTACPPRRRRADARPRGQPQPAGVRRPSRRDSRPGRQRATRARPGRPAALGRRTPPSRLASHGGRAGRCRTPRRGARRGRRPRLRATPRRSDRRSPRWVNPGRKSQASGDRGARRAVPGSAKLPREVIGTEAREDSKLSARLGRWLLTRPYDRNPSSSSPCRGDCVGNLCSMSPCRGRLGNSV